MSERLYAPVPRRWLDIIEVAAVFGVRSWTAQRWARRGELPAVRVRGRYYISPEAVWGWRPPAHSAARFQPEIWARIVAEVAGQGARVPGRHWWPVAQVAQMFGVSGTTVGNWIRGGLLPAQREEQTGDWRIADVELLRFVPPRRSTAWFNREIYEAFRQRT